MSLTLWLALVLLTPQVQDGDSNQSSSQVERLSIQDLLQLEVSLASRKDQHLMDAAAAIYVIRGEDIRRTGTTSIAEALRQVPGFQVGRINSNTWGISARGFNFRWANKLQVLVDGQSVYEPGFGGVSWDIVDTNLEDIDRIEVIRGPGGALWGANAVNGIINIVTKKGRDSVGTYASVGAGTLDQDSATARYGWKESEDLFCRVYAKYFNRDDFRHGRDDWFQSRAGFRADWSLSTEDLLTFLGDIYEGYSRMTQAETRLSPPSSSEPATSADVLGGSFITRWERTLGADSSIRAQLSYKHNGRDKDILNIREDTLDLDFQHRFPLGPQDLIWGVGYRIVDDHRGGTFTLQYDDEDSRHDVVSAFIQDEIRILDNLRLIIGAKLEHNDFTGLETQPNLRLMWRPGERHALWAAFARAVRSPARTDDGFRANAFARPGFAPPFRPLVGAFISRDLDTESVHALELGYRIQPADTLSMDMAVFYNRYFELGAASTRFIPNEMEPAPAHDVLAFLADNAMSGHTYGIEAAATWKPLPDLTFLASYSYLELKLDADDPAYESSESAEGASPRHQAYLRASVNPLPDVEFDVIGRYVSRLRSLDIDGYIQADARIGWRVHPNCEVALAGQNLLRDGHAEFMDSHDTGEPVDIGRTVHFSLTVRF